MKHLQARIVARALRLTLGLAAVVVLGACDDSEKGGLRFRSDTDATPSRGVFGVVNAIVDSPTVFVAYSSTSPAIGDRGVANLDFADADLFTIISQTYEITVGYVEPSGEQVELLTFTEADGTAIEVTIDDERILVLTGTIDSPEAYVIEAVEYQNGIPVPTDGSVIITDPEVHFTHVALAEAGRVLDFYLTASGTDLADVAPSASLAYKETSPMTAIPVSDDLRLRVTPQGDDSTILYDSGTFPVDINTRFLFAAFDYFGPGGADVRVRPITSFALVFPGEDLPNATRVLNLVSDLSSIDVYIGGTASPPVHEDVAEGAFSPYVEQDGGTTTVAITPNAVPDDVLLDTGLFFPAGESTTLVIAGAAADDAGDPDIIAFASVDETREVVTSIQVRGLHASPSGSLIDLFVLAPGLDISTQAAATFQAFTLGSTDVVDFEPGEYDLLAIDVLNGAELIGPERITLEADTNYLLLLKDSPGGGPPVRYELVELN